MTLLKKKKKSECDNQIDDLKKDIEGLKSKEKRKSVEHDKSLKEIDLRIKCFPLKWTC